jgi:hypothetical protein
MEPATSVASPPLPSVLNTTLAAYVGTVTQHVEHGTPLEDDVALRRAENLG